jgi:hypothetical protein
MISAVVRLKVLSTDLPVLLLTTGLNGQRLSAMLA